MLEDPFAKYAQGNGINYSGVMMLMKFLQTKPEVKNMNITYYGLYYTVFKKRDERDNVHNQYENDCINFSDFLTPNHYIGIKNDNSI